MKHNKLVRDKIPEYIRKRGGVPVSHVADEKEYWEKLREKLVEEAEEFREAGSKEEFADLLEIIDAIMAHQKYDPEEIASIRDKKAKERGRFEKRIILDES